MTIYSGQVSTSTDDGEQASSGTVTLNGGSAVTDNSVPYSAFRIQNVTVPSGATISASAISLFFSGTRTATNFTIYGNDVASPSTLAATTSYISALTRTTQSATWSAAITDGQFNASPDISSITSALITLGGWASGNPMLFIMNGTESITFAAAWITYDGTPSEAPELSITYTSVGSGAGSQLLTMGCGG